MESPIVPTEKFSVDEDRYVTYQSRLETFSEWAVDQLPKADQLARCGFYLSIHPTKMYCFYCGRYKNDWKPFDNPWVEHALLCPGCPFMLLNRSSQDSYNWNSSLPLVKTVSLFQTCQEKIRELMSSAEVQVEKKLPDCTALLQYVEDNRCKVCLEKEAEYVLLPCAHLGYCLDCVSMLKICAVCRKRHSAILKVFKS